MNTCAWCGISGGLSRTKPLAGHHTRDWRPILVCGNRDACRRRAEDLTNHVLTGAPR